MNNTTPRATSKDVARVWVIRGGEGNRLVDEFVDGNVIGIGYYSVPDGSTLSTVDVVAILRAEKATIPEQRAEWFRSFVADMAPGDIVVMPDTPRGEVVIGEIAGDYEYHEAIPVDRYRHRRPVEWLGRHPHASLPNGHQDLYKQRPTLRLLDAPELLAHAERVRRREIGRPATDRSGRLRKTPRSGTGGRSVGGPSADGVCPSCGQLRPATQLAEHGGQCADCAADV